jgi:hypothetical protein
MLFLVAIGTCCGASACERRAPAPAVGDASTTSAAAPTGEQTLEPAAVDAGATATATTTRTPEPAASDAGVATTAQPPAAAEQPRPSWVPENATLTIVRSVDRDRNLGIALPPPVPALTVDAGSCDVGIEVRSKP